MCPFPFVTERIGSTPPLRRRWRRRSKTNLSRKNSHRKYVNRISLEWSRSVASEHTVVSFGFVPNDQTSREPTHSNRHSSTSLLRLAHIQHFPRPTTTAAAAAAHTRFTPQIDSHSFSFRCTYTRRSSRTEWCCEVQNVLCSHGCLSSTKSGSVAYSHIKNVNDALVQLKSNAIVWRAYRERKRRTEHKHKRTRIESSLLHESDFSKQEHRNAFDAHIRVLKWMSFAAATVRRKNETKDSLSRRERLKLKLRQLLSIRICSRIIYNIYSVSSETENGRVLSATDDERWCEAMK